SEALRELAHLTGAPVTSTLMGLGAFPASDPQWLGMLGMHGSFESHHAMHDADVMLCLGARFDDRITGRLDAFAPNSKKVHVDIDPSSINKNVLADIGIVGDAGKVIEAVVAVWKAKAYKKPDLKGWWADLDGWRARKGFAYRKDSKVIKPQYAIERLY